MIIIQKLFNMKPGRVTRSPFFNFMRDYRRMNKGKATEMVKKGAGVWRNLDYTKKQPYIDQAKHARRLPKDKKKGASLKKSKTFKKSSVSLKKSSVSLKKSKNSVGSKRSKSNGGQRKEE
ncbi:unnamed protein product [Brassicogethes aeneus]|uniref:HMG box domain-containing protein n=1 Tax=Brassicogethes aeneus TaxID=1431903 RepID=A0A9P0FJN3_BRAAE|nr:unnamed protein product [Brassicogethes aeneus]